MYPPIINCALAPPFIDDDEPPTDFYPYRDDEHEPDIPPCQVCGSTTYCGYDLDGNAWIHARVEGD